VQDPCRTQERLRSLQATTPPSEQLPRRPVEGQLRMIVRIEEISIFQMRIPLIIIRRNRFYICRELNFCCAEIITFSLHATGKLFELACYGRDHQVFYFEIHF